jgi:hypothetical protein
MKWTSLLNCKENETKCTLFNNMIKLHIVFYKGQLDNGLLHHYKNYKDPLIYESCSYIKIVPTDLTTNRFAVCPHPCHFGPFTLRQFQLTWPQANLQSAHIHVTSVHLHWDSSNWPDLEPICSLPTSMSLCSIYTKTVPTDLTSSQFAVCPHPCHFGPLTLRQFQLTWPRANLQSAHIHVTWFIFWDSSNWQALGTFTHMSAMWHHPTEWVISKSVSTSVYMILHRTPRALKPKSPSPVAISKYQRFNVIVLFAWVLFTWGSIYTPPALTILDYPKTAKTTSSGQNSSSFPMTFFLTDLKLILNYLQPSSGKTTINVCELGIEPMSSGPGVKVLNFTVPLQTVTGTHINTFQTFSH